MHNPHIIQQHISSLNTTKRASPEIPPSESSAEKARVQEARMTENQGLEQNPVPPDDQTVPDDT